MGTIEVRLQSLIVFTLTSILLLASLLGLQQSKWSSVDSREMMLRALQGQASLSVCLSTGSIGVY